MADDKLEWLNQADADELEKIPGLGRNRAEDIVNFREQNGSFDSWDDLKKVPGLNEEMINKLKEAGPAAG
ncbi:MAG TPA: helix-hairpin-helix domain-containing protein [Candidatus Paceibacterota bacterium]|nr:helix-hairpin-helix domain-containing protein [Candidatus Paceibacterota bacterium]